MTSRDLIWSCDSSNWYFADLLSLIAFTEPVATPKKAPGAESSAKIGIGGKITDFSGFVQYEIDDWV